MAEFELTAAVQEDAEPHQAGVRRDQRVDPVRGHRPDPWEDPANHIAFAAGTSAWTQYEVTAQIPADASLMRFGVFLNGGGQLEFRHPELAPSPPGQQ